jgi:hypothetical protein
LKIWKWISLLVVIALTTGCTTTTSIRTYDLTKRQGVYVVGYTENEEVRQDFEDLLAEDLSEQGFGVWKSYNDLPEVTTLDPALVVSSANERSALTILVVNPVNEAATAPPVSDVNMQRQEQVRTDLLNHLAEVETDYDPEAVANVGVMLFLLSEKPPELVWSGSIKLFDSSQADASIETLSSMVTEALVGVRESIVPPI